ncbi:ABC transporter permease [Bacillus sp. SRB_336]|nr:ABC transporter permease [Bacillus sp. SRB_336]
MSNRKQFTAGLDRFSGLYLWAILIIAFGFLRPSTFLTPATVHAIASQESVQGIMALALLVCMACGQYDLSIGATANLAGLVVIQIQVEQHWAVLPAVLLGIAVGALIGLANGFIVVRLKVNSFIATLGMSTILAAVQTIVTNSQVPAPVTAPAWSNFTQTPVIGFQVVVVFLLAVAFLLWWFLDHTPAGRYIYASGGNADAARLSGVRVDRWAWISLTITGALSGFGGVLFTSLSGPSLTFGPALLLPAFAAVFLGSTQLTPGRFNVWGTLLAIFILATGVQGMQLVSGLQWLNDMFNGVALILAVALAASRIRLRGWRPRRPRPKPSASGEEDASAAAAAAAGVHAE